MPVALWGANQQFVQSEFGGPTEETEAEHVIGIDAVRIAGNDPECLALTIINLGANTAYVAFDEAVSGTRGIALNAQGGFVSMTVRDDEGLPAREWWAVTTTGTSDIYVIRTRRFTLG